MDHDAEKVQLKGAIYNLAQEHTIVPSTDQQALDPSPMGVDEHVKLGASTADGSAPDEAFITEKIMQRGEIAKMTRQLKEKLFKAGLKVRDQSSTGESGTASLNAMNSPHASRGPLASSPTKTISENILNNISATAINNVQRNQTPNRDLVSGAGPRDMTPIVSPLKRRKGSFNELDISPSKRQMMLNSSPLLSNGSPYSSRALLQTPQSLSSQQAQSFNNIAPAQPSTPPPTFAQVASRQTEALLSTPQHKKGTKNDNGADLLLYLLKSPANNSGKAPTTPKLTPMTASAGAAGDLGMNLFGEHQYGATFSPNLMASGQRCPQTPNAHLGGTPSNRFQTPLTPKRIKGTPGFSLMDFINFSPNCARTPDLSAHEFPRVSNLGDDPSNEHLH